MSEEKKSPDNSQPNPWAPQAAPKPPPPASGVNPWAPQAAPAKKRGWLTVVIVLLIILVVGGLLFRLLTLKPKTAPPPQPVRVSTTNAIKGDIGIYVSALGLVTPLATVSISSQVTGQLTNVNFVEGQMVKAGDLLAQIDERPFQAQLTAAEGTLERDQALLDEARINLKRYEEAAAHNAIPKQQLEDQRSLVHQDEGTVKFDQGQVDNAKVQLAYCRIVSLISGRVGLRLVDPGNLVQSTSTNALAVVTQLQPITVIFSVAEDYLPQIQHQLGIGNHMTVDAFDRAQQTQIATGSVLALDNVIDTLTGTVRLRSVFTNQDNALFPNQFVNVRLLIDTLKDKTLIPAAAVQRNAQSAFVYVVKSDQTVEMRTIKTDATDVDTIAVEDLQPGETIVTDNFNRLSDKSKVAVRKPGDESAEKPAQGKSGDGKDGKSGKGKRGGAKEEKN